MNTELDPGSFLDGIDLKRLGERLQLARKTKGLTQDVVATQLNVARTTLVAIEKGERRITESELIFLAELYDKNIFDFVNPHAPNADIAVQFRSLLQKKLFPTDELDHLDAAIQELQIYAERSVELEKIVERPFKPRYPRQRNIQAALNLEYEADEAAEEQRAWLGLGDGPIHDLREVLEDKVGLRIFFFKMNSKVAGLFGYAKELGGCIAINSDHRRERQTMSLAHEYGHVVENLERPDVQVQRVSNRKSDAEKFAELFAMRFLLPSSGVERQIRTYLQTRGDNNKLGPRDFVFLASGYRVSFQAYVQRLEELKIVPAGHYDRIMLEDFRPDKAKEILGLPVLVADTQKYPRHYQMMVLEAYQRGLLSLDELARFLDTDMLEARRRIEQYVANLSAKASEAESNLDVTIKL
jgi:Zn-dependent peptidase ImmA (M78 family)/DNA-binding XRE family transcriptional regulator